MSSNRGNQPPLHLVTDPSSSSTTSTSCTTNTNPCIQHQTRPSVPYKQSLLSILARHHAGYFRISLSLGCQALLWKTLSSSSPNSHGQTSPISHILDSVLPSTSFLVMWILSISVLISLSILYMLKCFFHFHLVKAEYLHHVGVNYLFAPWISFLLLLQSAPTWLIPPRAAVYSTLWWVFSIPIIALDVKIYGQWFTAKKRFLANMANPTSQISVLGNLVAAQAAAHMGWKETAVCMFSLGMAHYLVLFVTLYQQLSCGDRLPTMLRPVFSLFFAVPSVSSFAWSSVSGGYDTASKMLFFLSLFIFASLACRPNLFKKSMRRFNVAWWAYSFPLSFLALASTEYATEVKGHVALGLMILLSVLSVIVFLALMLSTALNVSKLFRENDPMLNFAKEPRT